MVDLEDLLQEKGYYCFSPENFKNGYTVCIVYGEISEGSGPKLHLDPPLLSLMEVANVDSTVSY